MSIILKIIKRYRSFLISLSFIIIFYFINSDIAINTALNVKSSFIQMISVLPPIMILLGLLDIWVPKKILMKYMGNNSGVLGIFLSILLGSLAAGPMYAAFPFTSILLKKGVKFSNIIIFMNAWCVTKVSTLLFEISALGYKFTIARLLIDIPGIIIMGYVVNYFMDDKSLEKLYHN